jgi:hypothetical protein
MQGHFDDPVNWCPDNELVPLAEAWTCPTCHRVYATADADEWADEYNAEDDGPTLV